MKKKGFTLVELLVVIAIIALLMGILMPVLSKIKNAIEGERTEQSQSEVQEKRKNYSIEYLSPEIIRIVPNCEVSQLFKIYSYGPVFAEAIKQVSKSYVIEQETTIIGEYWDGSVTCELHLIVKPREAVEAEITEVNGDEL